MAKSYVKKINGTVKLFVNDEIAPSCAYTTYFHERNCYKEFADAGYQLYSVTIAFGTGSMNSFKGYTPHEAGIFDNENGPDFTIVDEAINKVIRANPNAYIFPRVFMTMPEWWCEQHPEETIVDPCGKMREMLFSDAYRKDGGEMLKQLIKHIESKPYAENIIGYHLAGGCTEEWFHYDRNGSVCDNTKKYFFRFLDEKYPEEKLPRELPNLQNLKVMGEIQDKLLTRYLEFSNTAVADSIMHFAKIVKEATNYEQTVGVFYGYLNEVGNPLNGDLALNYIIDCDDIDFYCSPNSYINTRGLGIDWGDMMPFSSLKEHNKIYFSECDIRTSLTDYINNCRPGSDKNNQYYDPIYLGPKSIFKSVAAMRKAFSHQITRGNSLWWFDMWGRWYSHPKYMAEVRRCRKLCETLDYEQYGFKSEIAVFIDGSLYYRHGMGHQSVWSQNSIRNSLGNSGLSYDMYLLDDFKANYKKYKAIILPATLHTDELLKAKKMCEEAGIPVLLGSVEKYKFTPEELRDFARSAKAHVFCESDDVICYGNSLLSIHSATAGEKKIKLPKTATVKNVCSNKAPFRADEITVKMKKHQTLIFTLKD